MHLTIMLVHQFSAMAFTDTQLYISNILNPAKYLIQLNILIQLIVLIQLNAQLAMGQLWETF